MVDKVRQKLGEVREEVHNCLGYLVEEQGGNSPDLPADYCILHILHRSLHHMVVAEAQSCGTSAAFAKPCGDVFSSRMH